MKRALLLVAAAAFTVGLQASSANAAILDVYCPTAPISGDRDTQLKLTYDNTLLGSATCYDYGDAGGSGNYTVTVGAIVIPDNSVIELPTGTDQLQKEDGVLASGPYFSGDVNGATDGTVTFNSGNTGTLYLTFKTGGGSNDPYFFVFALTGVDAGDTIGWAILDPDAPPLNALSHMELFGQDDIFDVPEPTSLALLGLGLLGAGIMRRRRV